jgi:Gas vesicle protein
MGVERASGELSYVDILDRVLDKGIVIDGWMRISLMGLDLVTVRGCAVVASLGTYTKLAGALGARATPQPVSRNRRNKSGEKDRYSPPWLFDLLERLPDRP